MYVDGRPAGAGMSSNGTQGSPGVFGSYRISTMIRAGLPGRSGVTRTFTSRSDAAKVAARSGRMRVVPGWFGLVIGVGTVAAR